MNATLEAPGPRVAVVTGASRGIGRAVALALAAEGVHIVALARTQGGLEELDDAIRAARRGAENSATLVPCDLQAIMRRSTGSARRCFGVGAVSTFSSATPALLGPLSPLHHVDPKPWDDVMSVNVTANWRLVRALDPLLRPIEGRPRGFRHVGRRRAERTFAPIGAPTPPRKPRSTPSPEPMRPRPSTTFEGPRHARQSGRVADRMRAAAMPGEDPLTLRTPEESGAEDRRALLHPPGARPASSMIFRPIAVELLGSAVSALHSHQRLRERNPAGRPIFACALAGALAYKRATSRRPAGG